MGWVVGFEPTTFGTTIRRSTKLSYTHRDRELYYRIKPAKPPQTGAAAGYLSLTPGFPSRPASAPGTGSREH